MVQITCGVLSVVFLAVLQILPYPWGQDCRQAGDAFQKFDSGETVFRNRKKGILYEEERD